MAGRRMANKRQQDEGLCDMALLPRLASRELKLFGVPTKATQASREFFGIIFRTPKAIKLSYTNDRTMNH